MINDLIFLIWKPLQRPFLLSLALWPEPLPVDRMDVFIFATQQPIDDNFLLLFYCLLGQVEMVFDHIDSSIHDDLEFMMALGVNHCVDFAY
jgi:hypothetical protein